MRTHIKIAEKISHLLDSQFSFAGFRFGIDPVLGLIPGIGDLISLLFSLYIIWIAQEAKVPPQHIKTMYRNILFDLVIGSIPIIGDITDFIYKANRKNVELLKKHAQHIEEGDIS